MTAAIPEPDVCEIMRRAACLPYGLSLIQFGWAPCAAAMLGASVEAAVAAQAALADPAARPVLVAEYDRTVTQREIDPEAHCRQCAAEGRAPSPGCPLALIREAEARPSGLDTLRSTDVEVAAAAFRVHPFVVLGAREWLARRERPEP